MLNLISLRAELPTPKDVTPRLEYFAAQQGVQLDQVTIVVWTVKGSREAIKQIDRQKVTPVDVNGLTEVRIPYLDTEGMSEVGRRCTVADPDQVTTNSPEWLTWALTAVPLISGGSADMDPIPTPGEAEEPSSALDAHAVEEEDRESAEEDADAEAAGEEDSGNVKEAAEEDDEGPLTPVKVTAQQLKESTVAELRDLLPGVKSLGLLEDAIKLEEESEKPRNSVLRLCEARKSDIMRTAAKADQAKKKQTAEKRREKAVAEKDAEIQKAHAERDSLEGDEKALIEALMSLVKTKNVSYAKRFVMRHLNALAGGDASGPLYHEPGLVFTKSKTHRNEWGKVTYTIRCLEGGKYELVDYEPSPSSPTQRDDLERGTIYEHGKALLQAVSGKDVPGMSVYYYFRLAARNS